MNGMGNGRFQPGGSTTRAQLVTILYRLMGEPEVSAKTPFKDLKQDWYKNAVAWAYENDIVTGTTATTFAPGKDVTREQMAAIFYRYCTNYLGMSADTTAELDDFSDASSVSKYAKEALVWCVDKGLINGTSAKTPTLTPKGTATRAQIATVINRFFLLVNDAAPAEEPVVFKPEIAFDEFEKVEMRVAKVLACEKVKKSKKLLKFTLDDGEGERIILSGIAEYYDPEELVGKNIAYVANLAPRKMMGIESCGMILSAESGDGLKVVTIDDSILPGGSLV